MYMYMYVCTQRERGRFVEESIFWRDMIRDNLLGTAEGRERDMS